MKLNFTKHFALFFMLFLLFSSFSCFLFDNDFTVTTPIFSPSSDVVYTSPIQVSISCATEGATIRYTLDGSMPSQTTGTIYDGNPIYLSTTTTIKAMAYKTGLSDSAVVSKTYQINIQSSNSYDNIQSPFTESFAPNDSWTFMIYMDGDNNLEDAAIEDFNEIISGLNNLNNPNIKVVVLIDRISGYDDINFLGEASNWTGARLYQMNQNGTYTKKTDGWFTDGDELNMGDPQTLKNFINYCKTKYSSSHYALILWNHGGGARSRSTKSITKSVATEKAVCWDDSNNGDCLYLDEVQQAISQYFNSSNKLDFLGFDACLMGTVEVAYEFRDLALVMAASMANEWGDGWDYEAIFKGMATGTNNDAKELGKLIVKAYHDSTVTQSDQTLAAIDLTKISSLKTAIDNLAVAIYYEDKKSTIENIRDTAYHFYENDEDSISYPYFDLNDFVIKLKNDSQISNAIKTCADNVIDSLSQAIICAYAGSYYGNYYGLGSQVKRGLSIFISRGNLIYTTQQNSYTHYAFQWWYTSEDTNAWWTGGHYYGKIDFAYSDADGSVEFWRELFEAWYDPNNNYTPSSY